jgi:hypothetical protein
MQPNFRLASYGEGSMVRGIRSQSTAEATAAVVAVPQGDDILYVGMNPGARSELLALRTGFGRVEGIFDALVPDLGGHRGQTFELSTQSGIDAMVRTLGIGPQRESRVAQAIAAGGHDARDELASIARVWSRSSVPPRLVISAHYVGDGPSGENNGKMTWDALASLARALPEAAAQVEDVHLAGCNTGYLSVDRMAAMFPNLKTVWAYRKSAPGARNGAQRHMKAWESATRGRTQSIELKRRSLGRHGENVVLWSQSRGYRDARQVPLAQLWREYQARRYLIDAYFAGEREVTDPHKGELRDLYEHLQALLGRQDFSGDRAALEHERALIVRLLYYDRIRKRFQGVFRDRLRTAYDFSGIGGRPPDFSHLSRNRRGHCSHRIKRRKCHRW